MYRLYNVKKAIGLRFLFFAYSPMMIFFIPRNEFNVYLKQIKVILSAVKKISYLFTSDEYDFILFTIANRGCFDNLGFTFFPKRSGMHRSCLTLYYGRSHVQ